VEEPERLPKYRKDPRAEARLQALNELLQPLQLERESRLDGPARGLVFVIGAPRSGTTLVSQLLARSGCFGYISNFVARFWLAPAIGALIERSLGIDAEAPRAAYESSYGVTRGWASPHEFGYFWSGWFDRGQPTHLLPPEKLDEIDSSRLRRRVASIEAVYDQPMSFKNNTWCTFQAAWLARIFPEAVFVVCRRDPLYLAQSLALARRERLGSVDAWWSVRPPSYPHLLELPWWDQVAEQARDIERTMDAQLASIAAERVLDAPYLDLCADPIRLVQRIAERCELAVPASDCLGASIPRAFEHTDVQKLGDEEWERLRASVQRAEQ